MMSRDQTLQPDDVESLIAAGHAIVINQGRVLKLDSWLDQHPGGKLVVEHMVGRDATDEINAYEAPIPAFPRPVTPILAPVGPRGKQTKERGNIILLDDLLYESLLLILSRYHLPHTLKRMNAFQIGRVPTEHPWPNFTPPIRGGVFRQTIPPDDFEDFSSESSSDQHDFDFFSRSFNSSNTSVNLIPEETSSAHEDREHALQNYKTEPFLTVQQPCRKRRPNASATSHLPTRALTKEARISVMISKGINEDVRDFPSLDASTQDQIAREYRALHERVKAEGYYDCRYLEYGKEAIRYSLLFSAFAIFLRMEYYIISAIFLGLFWVCY